MIQFIRILLFPFSLIYGLVGMFRNFLFDFGILKSTSFDIPIISIGNLSMGGTGKTPQIKYLIELLLQQDKSVAVLSRGYKRTSRGFILANEDSTASEIGDEPMEISLRFPLVQIAVCESRVEGVKNLLDLESPPDVILLDDAYQHRSIKPGLSILLTTYEKPYYTDFVLPTGNLREFTSGRKRADLVIVTKCPDNLAKDEEQKIGSKLSLLPTQQLFFSKNTISRIWHLFREGQELSNIPDSVAVYLITALADPSPIEAMIKSGGNDFTSFTFPDHHNYKESDIQQLINSFDENGQLSKMIFTTPKDAVKLMHFASLRNYPVYVIENNVEFFSPMEFDKLVLNFLNRTAFISKA